MRERHLEYLPVADENMRVIGIMGTERSRGEQNASDEIMEAQELIKARTTELKAENPEKFAQKRTPCGVMASKCAGHGSTVSYASNPPLTASKG